MRGWRLRRWNSLEEGGRNLLHVTLDFRCYLFKKSNKGSRKQYKWGSGGEKFSYQSSPLEWWPALPFWNSAIASTLKEASLRASEGANHTNKIWRHSGCLRQKGKKVLECCPSLALDTQGMGDLGVSRRITWSKIKRFWNVLQTLNWIFHLWATRTSSVGQTHHLHTLTSKPLICSRMFWRKWKN